VEEKPELVPVFHTRLADAYRRRAALSAPTVPVVFSQATPPGVPRAAPVHSGRFVSASLPVIPAQRRGDGPTSAFQPTG
jgi:hypothetical protein